MDKNYEIRLKNVKLMHETMIDMNDEGAYFSWIYVMPDCPTEDDFEWFASDEDEYMELYNSFMKFLKYYAEGGLYKPSKEVRDFVSKLGIEIDILD